MEPDRDRVVRGSPSAAFDINVGDVVTADGYDLDRTLERQPLNPEVAITDNPASTRPISTKAMIAPNDPTAIPKADNLPLQSAKMSGMASEQASSTTRAL